MMWEFAKTLEFPFVRFGKRAVSTFANSRSFVAKSQKSEFFICGKIACRKLRFRCSFYVAIFVTDVVFFETSLGCFVVAIDAIMVFLECRNIQYLSKK